MVSRLVDPSLDLTKALDGEKETLSVRAGVRGGGGRGVVVGSLFVGD